MKRETAVDYHECYEWSLKEMPRPDPPSEERRAREGTWAATGDFVWGAVSDGVDEHAELYRERGMVLDLRKKDYKYVEGTKSFYSFESKLGATSPVTWARFLPCRCSACRINSTGMDCPFMTRQDCFTGHQSQHNTHLKKIWTDQDTKAKREADKRKRESDKAAKVQKIRGEILGTAPHRTAATIVTPEQALPMGVQDALDDQFLTIVQQQQQQQQQLAAQQPE